MTFDDVEPRKDPNLSIQAYYARLNPLSELLSPLSRELLFGVWEATGTLERKELNRSTIVGILVGDLIRALDLREITSGIVQRGQWFVHSGPTYYTRQGDDRKRAVIRLDDGRRITATVPRSREITATADSNMDGKDEVSIVVGRLLTDERFDLKRIIHGLTVQLPTYMRSASAASGIFAVMCHERDPQDVANLLSRQAIQPEDDIRLMIETVDCRERQSASRAPRLPSNT